MECSIGERASGVGSVLSDNWIRSDMREAFFSASFFFDKLIPIGEL
jgi:hypothetical protein